MNNIYAFEFQRGNESVFRIIPNDGVVAECQAFNLAKANGWVLIGIYETNSGIHRQVIFRP